MSTTIRAFHGSGTKIDQFDYRFTNIGNDQLGSGFYFTSCRSEAIGYCTQRLHGDTIKPGGMLHPTLHEVDLIIKNPLLHNAEIKMSEQCVRNIILQSPKIDEVLENWGEIAVEGREAVLKRAIECYAIDEPYPAIRLLNQLSNDFFGDHTELFHRAVREQTGFDGVILHFDERVHYVAWFPEQIVNIHHHDLIESLMMKAGVGSSQELEAGMLLYYGTDSKSAESIIHGGVRKDECYDGYYGRGFCLEIDPLEALADHDPSNEDRVVVAFRLTTIDNILDLGNEAHLVIHNDMIAGQGAISSAGEYNIRAAYDQANSQVFIYDKAVVQPIGIVHHDTIARIHDERYAERYQLQRAKPSF